MVHALTQTRRTRAVVIDRIGPPRVLEEREVPLRDPDPGEVHLRVAAAGVNFADLVMRMGMYATVPPRPFTPGFEVAGWVARVGTAVRDWRAGDRAVALMRHGGYAADVILPADHLFPWPANLSPAQAAAVPVNFLTAWLGLVRVSAARPGERALVLGAGGGVGTAAVQLAVRAGLDVLATAGTEEKRRFVVERLGARACFDSRGDWEDETRRAAGARGIDIALDPVGGAATRACLRLLAPLGRLVFYGLSAAVPGRKRSRLRAIGAWMRTPRIHPGRLTRPNIGIHGIHLLHLGHRENVLREGYAEILGDLESGRLVPVVDRTYPLDRDGAVAAHERLHARANLGKVVLVANDDAARAAVT